MSLVNDQLEQLTPLEEFEKRYDNEPWVCPVEHRWYYHDTKAPNDQLSVIGSTFFNPLMEFIGLGSPPEDPTFGRYTLPFSPKEKLIRDNPSYTCWSARVFLDQSGRPVKEKTSRWIWYQVWWDEIAAKKTGTSIDLCFLHGIAEYGGKFAPTAKEFLDAGYRLIVPDLPSHGRSTGLHCYLNDLHDLGHAVHIVLTDVLERDLSVGRLQRRVIVSGGSMGGSTAVLYALLYQTPTISEPIIKIEGAPTPRVLGIIPLCPMLAISPETMPHPSITLFAKFMRFFIGRLPIVNGPKGKGSQDRWAEDQLISDPQTYHSNVRCATGLAILKILEFTDRYMNEITLPFLVLHGDSDRVTSVEGSKRFFKISKSNNKAIIIYPRMEHVMLRVGRDEVDDQARLKVVNDMLTWMDRIHQNNV